MLKVVMLDLALNDLEVIFNYLEKNSLDVAIKQYDHIMQEIRKLKQFPEMCEQYSVGMRVYRRLVVDDYLVFYMVTDEEIQIHRILHGRRDLKQFF